MTAPAAGLGLVMPMAGRGSRFARAGERLPKPLIDLHGRPFFWWAVESVLRCARVEELVFVVLAEHDHDFAIGERVRAYYPQAQVVVIPQATAGAAETAALGVRALTGARPFAVNDCDHAFEADELGGVVEHLAAGRAAGALVGFPSTSPNFSYARFAADGSVVGTVEKEVAGPFALAGCYFFADRHRFGRAYRRYRQACRYPELFLSGMFDLMARDGDKVLFQPLRRHLAFGTPEELAALGAADLARLQAVTA